jgi:hypothetical protein
VLARYGSDWLQADVTGSGTVWLRADQVLDLPADLVDLQPPPQPQVVYIASQPAAAPTYDPPAAPQEPAPTMAPQMMVLYDRQQWGAQAATARAGR